ncbi:transcriptional repressor [Sphingobacterium faecale]|uniref:Transcriptional repressor n=1 Tax=Sphingobacterium faecale TaxID=2803775 RepID=A0ABS1QXU0_9SPHI|nr:transcriptional repressor [Sphingobacterium faecale]MBL1407254.1 transcriptional repressor [Sphingobacterium faecale]
MEQTKASILSLLADQGYLISQQRRIIIDTLCKTQYIGSVEDLWVTIRSSHNVSWATVHKTVRLLEHLGCIIRTTVYDRHQQYTLAPLS